MQTAQNNYTAITKALAQQESQVTQNGWGLPPLPDSLTENGAFAYSSTGNALLDLFTMGVRDMEENQLLELFRKAWLEDPKKSMALAMNLRDAREGKGEKLLTFYIMGWLRTFKPLTYLLNLGYFVEMGCYKDLCKMVEMVHKKKELKLGQQDYIELELLAEIIQNDQAQLKLSQSMETDFPDLAPQGPDTTNSTAKSSFTGFFGSFMSSEKETDSSETKKETKKVPLTLSGKWAPSEGTHFDYKKHGNQAYRLAKLMFPESETPQKDYRLTVTALRKHLEVVECLMATNQWDRIDFGKVPAKAHRLLREAFKKHQPERYQAYLDGLAKGTEKINVKGTQPHELVSYYLKNWSNSKFDQTIESQFWTMIDELKKKGVLKRAQAIVDVSGSMAGQPMEVSIALGLIVAKMTQAPFNNRVVTFSANPQVHEIKGETLQQIVRDMQGMDWGANTNLLKVFDLLLDLAKEQQVAPEDMVDTLFIFTDMQFDAAQRDREWATTYQLIQRKYEACGYQVPQIVFWNLRASVAKALPVTKDVPGTALVSGFSAELLKVFMEGGDFTPMAIMERTLAPYLDKVQVHPSETGP